MNIYVGNLSLETSADELRQEFAAFGQVISVTIMNDKYIGSGQAIGYGYVEMASKSEGTAAIAGLTGKKVRNRPLSVVEALPLSEKNHKESSRVVRLPIRSSRSRQRRYTAQNLSS